MSKKYVLVIGINQYKSFKLLPKAASDAEAIAIFFAAHNYEVTRIPSKLVDKERWVIDCDKKLTRKEIIKEIKNFLRTKADKEDAVIYFAGHGFRILNDTTDKYQSYLATSDSTKEGVNAIPFDDLNYLLKQSSLSSLLVLLDCCHAGAIVNTEFFSSIEDTIYDKYNSCFIAACRDFERAREGEEYGIFTEAVLNGLKKRYEGRSIVTCNDLIGHVVDCLKNSGQEPSHAGRNFSFPIISHFPQGAESTEIDETIDPYQGLEPFKKEQKDFFFGRKNIVNNLWESLGQKCFVAAIGSSGSGKSSVINAGLIPFSEHKNWKVLEVNFRFGTTLLSSLISTFEPLIEGIRQKRRLKELINQQQGLKNIVNELLHPDNLYLLVVDQFEKVFEAETEDRTQFINLLTEVSAKPYSRIAIVIAIRSDFVDRCTPYPLLSNLIQEQHVWILPLNGVDLEQAIIEPAHRLKYSVETELRVRIIEDVKQEPGFLPLLQFTLLRLWQERDRQTKQLKLQTYLEIGQIAGALNKQANDFYNTKSDLEKKLIEKIFLELVHTEVRGRDTRQRRSLDDILSIARNSEESQSIKDFIEELAGKDKRLLTTGSENNGEQWIDLAHEALIEKWDIFAEWCRKSRKWRQLKDTIFERYNEWEIHERSPDFLLPKTIIEQADLEQSKLESGAAIYPENPSILKFIRESNDRNKISQLDAEQRLIAIAKKAQELLRSDTPINGLKNTLELINDSLKFQQVSQDLVGILQDTLRQSMEISREQCRFDHDDGMVKCVAISPCNQWVVSGGRGKKLKLWNLQGECVREFPELHTATIWAVAFSLDGKSIVSGSEDRTLRLWNLEGDSISEALEGHTDCIRSVAVSPYGLIASASKDNTIRLWNSNGTPYGDGQPINGHTDWVLSVAFSPKDDFIVSGSADHTIRLWNLDGTPYRDRQPFKGHHRWVRSVSISPNSEFIVSGSGDNTVRLWNLDGTPKGQPFEGHKDRVLSVSISPNSDFIVSASADCTIRLWDLEGHPIGEVFKGHSDWIRSVRVSSNGEFIASASRDKTIRVWDLKGNLISQLFPLADPNNKGKVLSVAFSPSGLKIASGGEDNMIHLWDKETRTLELSLSGHNNWIRSVKFIDDEFLISGSADNNLLSWSLPLKEAIGTPGADGHNTWLRSVAVSPDKTYAVSSSNDKTVCKWNISDGICSSGGCFAKHDDHVLSVAISPDLSRQLVASGSADKTICLWELSGEAKINEPLKPIKTFKGHQSRVLSVTFFPTDGRYVLSGSEDKTLRLWDLDGNQRWKQEHDNKVRSVVFSPDGKYIASGSEDYTIRLWDIEGSPIGNPLKGHQKTVRSIKFSPDGKYLVSGSEDGSIRLWEVGTWKDWLEVCCDRIRYHPEFTSSGSFAELDQFIERWSSRSTATHQIDAQ
jgi:WD40 repeat protein